MYNNDIGARTPINQLKRRTMKELNGLLYSSIEQSYKSSLINITGIKKINVHKVVNIKLKINKLNKNRIEV